MQFLRRNAFITQEFHQKFRSRAREVLGYYLTNGQAVDIAKPEHWPEEERAALLLVIHLPFSLHYA